MAEPSVCVCHGWLGRPWAGLVRGLAYEAKPRVPKQKGLVSLFSPMPKQKGLASLFSPMPKQKGLVSRFSSMPKQKGLAFQGKPTKPALAEGPAGPGVKTRRRCNGHRHLRDKKMAFITQEKTPKMQWTPPSA